MSYNKPNLGICFATNDGYAMPTVVTMCSVLDNNANAASDKQVNIIVYVYADNWSEISLKNLETVATKYGAELVIKDPSAIYARLRKIDPDAWCGTFAADVRLFVGDEIDVDYNIACLDSDVIMLPGTDLYELAIFDFSKEKKSCASVIDLQSSPFMKKLPKLNKNQHIYNTNGIFLINPKLYKEHETASFFEKDARRIAYMSKPYKNVVRNAYSLKEEIITLPMKYQVYPAQRMLKIKQWFYIFKLSKREYYSFDEIKKAISSPVFIHFIWFIVNKPWNTFPVKEFPFQNEWIYYKNLTPYADVQNKTEVLSFLDSIKFFLYKNFTWLYVFFCAFFYRREVYKRNSIIKKRMKQTKIDF